MNINHVSNALPMQFPQTDGAKHNSISTPATAVKNSAELNFLTEGTIAPRGNQTAPVATKDLLGLGSERRDATSNSMKSDSIMGQQDGKSFNLMDTFKALFDSVEQLAAKVGSMASSGLAAVMSIVTPIIGSLKSVAGMIPGLPKF
ncbi:hypothetical protein V8G57_17075 [Collimonas sp. H4R21]|uniref:Uncharacterized protein n=1 Tax=Collimonas rhizosphaerae TaxID=3126357 RepID=A0ABU9PYQ1_9BURK